MSDMELSADDLVYYRGSLSLSVNRRFQPGIYLITGPIGAGKSTLSLLLSGHEQPHAGSIRRSGIGSEALILQFPEYHITGSTIAEEIRSWGVEPDDIGGSILPVRSLDADPLTLSRGELKRLTLACACALDPDLLIMDEPFSSLDYEMKQWLCTMIAARRSKMTIIFTHEREVLPDADVHLAMKNGRLFSLEEEERTKDIGVVQEEPSFCSGLHEHSDQKRAPGQPPGRGFFPIFEPDDRPVVFCDPRFRLLAVACLSMGAFLSIPGAAAALLWWVIAAWRRWAFPGRHLALALGMLILLPALVTELLVGGGLSYGIRMGSVLFLSFWAYTDVRSGEMFDLCVWAGRERYGFDIGLAAEMTMQGIALAVSDIRQIQRAYAIKKMKIGFSTFIPAAVTLLLLHLRRSEETATLLAIRGFTGGGTYEPVFMRGKKDVILALFAIIPLIISIYFFW